MLKSILLVAILGLASPASAAQDIIIDSRELFDDWSYPAGTLKVGENGLVRADSIRKNINAALNAPNFSYLHKFEGTGGIRSVGTAPGTADLAIDGDTTTVWTPSMADDVANWWIELDLGREVLAKKLRLVFDPAGPPFSNFRLFVSVGEPRFAGTKILDYKLVFQTVASNQDHIVEIPLHGVNARGDTLLGRPLQMAKLLLERKVADAGLAELEVLAVGDNISLGTVDRGGSIVGGTSTGPLVAIDGVVTSEWHTSRSGNVWLVQPGNAGNWFRLDLGATFWIEDLFLDTRSGMPGYRIFFSDGSESIVTREEVWQVDGRNLEWELGVDHDNKDISWARLNDFHFDPPRKARYLFWHQFHGIGAHVSGAFISEVMVFGQGFLPEVTLTSEVIETGGGYVTALEWEGETPPHTRILMRSRSGDAVLDTTFYFKSNGQPVKTQKEYDRLPKSFKGPTITQRLPIEEEWSGWTPFVAVSGEPFPSPSPTGFVQLAARLESDDPEVAPGLERVILRQADPLVRSIRGRIEPRITRPDSLTRFTFFLQPQTRFRDPGFNRILIRTPQVADSVEVKIDDAVVPSQLVMNQPDSLVIELTDATKRPVETSFVTSLGSDNTVFEGAVALGESPWQQVEAEAAELLTVRLPAFANTDRLLDDLQVVPSIFTPNGDGFNDEAVVRFVLLKVDVLRDLEVNFFDLSGRWVRQLYDQPGSSGVYEISWDGLDDSGRLVPPGLYLARVSIRVDVGDGSGAALVSIAY